MEISSWQSMRQQGKDKKKSCSPERYHGHRRDWLRSDSVYLDIEDSRVVAPSSYGSPRIVSGLDLRSTVAVLCPDVVRGIAVQCCPGGKLKIDRGERAMIKCLRIGSGNRGESRKAGVRIRTDICALVINMQVNRRRAP